MRFRQRKSAQGQDLNLWHYLARTALCAPHAGTKLSVPAPCENQKKRPAANSAGPSRDRKSAMTALSLAALLAAGPAWAQDMPALCAKYDCKYDVATDNCDCRGVKLPPPCGSPDNPCVIGPQGAASNSDGRCGGYDEPACPPGIAFRFPVTLYPTPTPDPPKNNYAGCPLTITGPDGKALKLTQSETTDTTGDIRAQCTYISQGNYRDGD